MAAVSELIAGAFAITDTHLRVATPCHSWETTLRVLDLRLTGEVVVRCGQCGLWWHACADTRRTAGQRRTVIWMSS